MYILQQTIILYLDLPTYVSFSSRSAGINLNVVFRNVYKGLMYSVQLCMLAIVIHVHYYRPSYIYRCYHIIYVTGPAKNRAVGYTKFDHFSDIQSLNDT